MSQLLRAYLSHKLTEKKSISDPEKLNDVIRSANIDLNPHQIDAAVFAFRSPLSRGAILADEVGLGKTIEAGLVINQVWVEGRQRILILVPASLRTQWQDELLNHFGLQTIIIDGQILKQLQKSKQKSNPLNDVGIYIASHNFCYRYEVFCKEIEWDLVVIDEAHRMRNVWRKSNKIAKIIKEVIKPYSKLLLTATPLQNNLMELFGLTSFIDENYLGTEFSFRTLFVQPVTKQKKYENLNQLKQRLMGSINKETGLHDGGIIARALRKQVRGFVPFTNRYCLTEDFALNDDEMRLYNFVSDYLHRPLLASTRATQRNMMELVYRKILASSSFAIAGTLGKVANFLSKRLQKEFKVKHEDLNVYAENIKTKLEKEWGKKLNKLDLAKIKQEEMEQEELPGLEDIETNQEKLVEEQQDADDLGEDEATLLPKDKPQEREIDHKFTKEEVQKEFEDVLIYHYLATTISVNAKSQALTNVLKKVFSYATTKEWPQKVVIFTESRRTQDHLERLLSGIGYNLVLFNGTNAGARAKEIYNEWEKVSPKEAAVGSKSINIRKALIWKYKQLDKCILITTEAGAEGLNLQFANIVINYDLPWNPQRVEQRIGRCHRYGQLLDVLVVNFLNKKNYADQRVYELLREKIKLFGNLFDFTDKVLGTETLTDDGYEVREVALAGLGAGIDFEKKVLSLYRNCRTEDQIKKGFQQLQLELSTLIEEKVEDAQKKVIQHFDEEVRHKLKIRNEAISNSMNHFDQLIKRYFHEIYSASLKIIDENTYELSNIKYCIGNVSSEKRDLGYVPIYVKSPLLQESINKDLLIEGRWSVTLSHMQEKARKLFEEYIGKEGQLILDLVTAKRKTITGQPDIFEKLIISAIIEEENGWKPIEAIRADKLLNLNIENEESFQDRIRDELVDQAGKSVQAYQVGVTKENENYVLDEIELLNTFSEEALIKFQQEIDERNKEIRELNKKSKATRTSGYHEVQQIQEEINKKQKELFKAQKKYMTAQEDQFIQKDKKISDLRDKLQMNFEVKRLAEVKFIIRE